MKNSISVDILKQTETKKISETTNLLQSVTGPDYTWSF